MKERARLHRNLGIPDYIENVKPEILSCMMSYVFEKDEEFFIYNLEVIKVSDNPKEDRSAFPVFICIGGDKVPQDGCRKIYKTRDKPDREPRKCDYCGNTEFERIENLEELKKWRDRYE